VITDDPNRIAVLAVGVEQYAHHGRNLRGPASQARAVARWAARVGIPAANIVLAASWADGQADHPVSGDPQGSSWRELGTNAEDIRQAVGHIGSLDIDTLVIYWCCHGFVDQNQGQRCLQVSDPMPGGPPVRTQYVSVEQLGAHFQDGFETRGRTVDQVRIVDACAMQDADTQPIPSAIMHMETAPSGAGAAIYQLSSAEVGSWSQFDTRTRTSHFSRLTQSWLDGHIELPVDVRGLFAHVVREIQRLIAANEATCRRPRVDASGAGIDFAFLNWPPIQALDRQRADLEGPFARTIRGFVPRERALARITTWLSDSERSGPLLVTGVSGTGKTALLGVVANLGMGAADIVDSAHWPPLVTPPRGSVDAAIYAKGLGTRQVLARIALAAGLADETIAAIADGLQGESDPIAQIAAHLRATGREIVVLVDALDRAEEPDQLVRAVFQPLIQACGDVVHLILGRAGAWEPWAAALERIALDAEYLDRGAVGSRVASLLRAPAAGSVSPWDAMDETVFAAAVEEIVAIAGSSFVLAEELASYQRTLPPPTAVDGDWIAGLPRSIRKGMEANLSQLESQGGAPRALALLLPLVYARGEGMPWTVWCDLANRFSSIDSFDPVVDRALRDALAEYATAGGPDPDQPRYRLRHDALADALLDVAPRRVPAEDERLIVAALRASCRSYASHRLDWTSFPYAVAHVIDHARAARAVDTTVDRLLIDLGLVLQASPTQLLTAFDESESTDVRKVATVYRNALRWLRDGMSLGDRAAQFSLAARQAGSELMSEEQAAELGASWTASWASWQLRSPHRRLVYGKHQVHALAVGERDGRSVILAGGADSHVREWDFASCQAHDPDRDGEVSGLAAYGPMLLSVKVDDSAVQRHDLDGDGRLPPFEGHTSPVRVLTVGRQGGVLLVASGDEDGVVHFWNAESGAPIGHERFAASICAIAMTSGGDGNLRVVAALEDGSLRMYVGERWHALDLPGHRSGRVVHALAIRPLPDGCSELITGAADHRVRAFRLGKDRRDPDIAALWTARHADAVNAVSLAEVDNLSVVVSASDDGTVRVWELETGDPVGAPYTEHGGWVRALHVHAGTDATEGAKVVSGGADGSVHMWELPRGGPVRGPFAGHGRAVRALALRELDGRELMWSASADGTIRRWDPVDGADRGPLPGLPRPRTPDWIGALATPESADASPVVWAGNRGVHVSIDADRSVGLLEGHGWVGSLVELKLHTGAAIAAAGAEGVPRVWDVAGWAERSAYVRPDGSPWHRSSVYALAVGKRGWLSLDAEDPVQSCSPMVLSADADGEIHFWDPATGNQLRPPLEAPPGAGRINALAVHQQLVLSAGDDGHFRIHDVSSGALVADEAAGGRAITALLVTDMGEDWLRVACGGADGKLSLWEVTLVGDAAPLLSRVGPEPVLAHRGGVRSLLAVKRGEDVVVYSGGGDGRIGVWDASLNRLVDSGHQGWVRAVAIARDREGAQVAVSGGDDATIRTWNLATGELRQTVRVSSRGSIRCLTAGHQGGKPVVGIGSTDNSARVFDISAMQLQPLVGHTDWVCAVALTTMGESEVLVSGSDDGSVRVWDLSSGLQLRLLTAKDMGSVRALVVDQQSTLLIGSRDKKVRIATLARPDEELQDLLDMKDPVQGLAVARIDGDRMVVVRDDGGRLKAKSLTDGPEMGAPLSGTGDVGAVAAATQIGHPTRVAVASGEVVTVSEWASGTWAHVASVDLGSEVLAVALDDVGRRLLTGARRGVALIDLGPPGWDPPIT